MSEVQIIILKKRKKDAQHTAELWSLAKHEDKRESTLICQQLCPAPVRIKYCLLVVAATDGQMRTYLAFDGKLTRVQWFAVRKLPGGPLSMASSNIAAATGAIIGLKLDKCSPADFCFRSQYTTSPPSWS